MYYLHGTFGFGKSYIFAALAVVLIRGKRRVVYLPDCRGRVRSLWTYMTNALVLTYAGDLKTLCYEFCTLLTLID
jgi:hypothetical protein